MSTEEGTWASRKIGKDKSILGEYLYDSKLNQTDIMIGLMEEGENKNIFSKILDWFIGLFN